MARIGKLNLMISHHLYITFALPLHHQIPLTLPMPKDSGFAAPLINVPYIIICGAHADRQAPCFDVPQCNNLPLCFQLG